jgi:hypothetical protein
MSQHTLSGRGLSWRVRAKAQERRWPRSAALAFGVAFTGTLAVSLLQGEKQFYNDSSEYWSLAATFTVHGHFSLLNFSNGERGYVLPLINHVIQVLATKLAWTSSSTVKLSNSLLFALIGTVLGPALMKTVWPRQPTWGVGRRLMLVALLVVFWSGYLNFPLSDFPGLAMALLTLVAVARSDSPGWMLMAGVALGMSINMRAAYIVFAPAVVALVAWTWLSQRGTRHASVSHRVLCAGLVMIGFAAISLPQSLAAHRHYGTWSFLPDASTVQPAGMFLGPGMTIEARDTYVGSGRSILMSYGYPAGQRLLAEQKGGKIASTSQYIALFASHPIVMGGLIVGHIVNSLDPLYSTPYIENLHNTGQTWGRIVGFLLVFIALLRVLWPAARRRLGPGRLWYLVALAACCATTVPSPIERRYMLVLYLLSYTLALMPGWPNPIRSSSDVVGLRRFQVAAIIAVSLLAYASVVWYFTDAALSNLRLD